MAAYVFAVVVTMLFVLTAFPAGGYAFARAFPRFGVLLAGTVASLTIAVWYCALLDGVGDDPMGAIGLGMMIWFTAFPVLFILGVVSGVLGRPAWVVGAWAGTVTAAILGASSPTLSAIAPLVFIACCVAGGLWKRSPASLPER